MKAKPHDAIAQIPEMSLEEALALIDRRFDADAILARDYELPDVAEYYRQSDRGYRLFHSRAGALHIALGCDSHTDANGYARQAEIFREHLDVLNARRAIEFGCGMGYNIRWLAETSPEREFVGVDLTESHIRSARKGCRGLPNAELTVANYQRLPHADDSFDAVLAVETLCQTKDLVAALCEAHRTLRPGGRLVNIDCFRAGPLDALPSNLRRAALLVEKTTAVNAFSVPEEFIAQGEDVGFLHVESRDLSEETGKNLKRLYSLARRFFRMPIAARAMARAFPPRLLENAICGLLMPFTVGLGAQVYGAIALGKPLGETSLAPDRES